MVQNPPVRIAKAHILLAAAKLLGHLCLISAVASSSSSNNSSSSNSSANDVQLVEALVPQDFTVRGMDQYVCFPVPLPEETLKLVSIEPLSEQSVVHHMLLFGCKQPASADPAWLCQMSRPCGGDFERIMYGWGKNAPLMQLPDGVGYSVGPGSAVQTLVLQVHYLQERPAGDRSGVRLGLTPRPTPLAAGMLSYAVGFQIPPHQPSTLVTNECCYSGFEQLTGFAFRVHTHMMGRSVYLDRMEQGSAVRLAEHDPQLPQGFTPAPELLTLRPGDRLRTTCDFDSSSAAHVVVAGATHANEMCNLYMMVYSQLPVFLACANSQAAAARRGAGGVPAPASLGADAHPAWQQPQGRAARGAAQVGQVAAVARGEGSTLWLFHRGDRVWEESSFTADGRHITYQTPIAAEAVVQVDQDTGEVMRSWGAGEFSMPHGLTPDPWGAVWVTDVGRHQAIKYSQEGDVLMSIGHDMEPGDGAEHLCKPTHVVVATNGDVYIADGYCNARVARFDHAGVYQDEFVLPPGRAPMSVPHSLVLDECHDALFVADREHGQVHRFDLRSREPSGTWDLQQLGLPYAITAGPYGTILALCWQRESTGRTHVALLAAEPGDGVEDSWEAEGVEAPHDLAVTAAPVPTHGSGDRALAVLVSETRVLGSALRKFILLPEGVTMEDLIAGGVESTSIGAAMVRHGIESVLGNGAASVREPEADSAVVPLKIGHPADEGEPSWPAAPGSSAQPADEDRQTAGVAAGDDLSAVQPTEGHASKQGDTGSALTHLLLVGAPFAFIFAVVALTLWKQLGVAPPEPAPKKGRASSPPSGEERIGLMIADAAQVASSSGLAKGSAHLRV